MMQSHFDLNNEEFEKAFQTQAIEPRLFTHEAHLRLAWIHITKYGVEQAIENISTQLLQFFHYVGARDKFNKTVTVAAIYAVHHFVRKSKTNAFVGFIQEFPQLKNNFKELLGTHYSENIVNSKKAKQEYVEPDLQPF